MNIYKFHPNIQLDYFKDINTKEKAYWLGFLYADGFLEANARRLTIELSKKDEILIDKFIDAIGLNPKYKSFIKEHNSCKIRFSNRIFSNHLIGKGYIAGKSKSKQIRFPEIIDLKFSLAFLLGCYDGDGITGTSQLSSGSRLFLEDIKSHFKINYEVRKYGNVYRLSLGADLFNQMLVNYKDSLDRKRIYLESSQEKTDKIIEIGLKNRKLEIPRDLLEKLVWKMPLYKVAKKISSDYGIKVSDVLIGRYCKEMNIKIPSKGYWKRKVL